jgi:hypothetical protein
LWYWRMKLISIDWVMNCTFNSYKLQLHFVALWSFEESGEKGNDNQRNAVSEHPFWYWNL